MTSGRGEHPADRLVRELIQTGRPASPAETSAILERMATAPFESRVRRVPIRDRGLTYLGHTLGARADSLTYHLVKRVIVDRQWPIGTDTARYLGDLRRAVRHPRARLMAYHRGGEDVAAVIVGTAEVLRIDRWHIDTLPFLVVVYSASRRVLASGYQFSVLGELNLPEDVQWLS